MNAPLRLVRPETSEPETTEDDARWAAVQRRDASADGSFWTCVKTTGVYCLPSCAGRPLRKNVVFADTRSGAEAAGLRPCKRCRPDRFVIGALNERLSDIDWTIAEAALDSNGWAPLGRILTDEECAALTGYYDDDERYRSTVAMRRHGFGDGEYRYFADPLPPLVTQLREGLYARLAPLANAWAAALNKEVYPPSHAAYRKHCAAAGQTRPTPLILKYGKGGYNRLHQDLYGGEIFPLQVAILLSQPGRDFTGGEFVLTEQTPRRQSRAMVAPLERGCAVSFAVNERPVKGVRGLYGVKMRHGVAEIRDGARYCLGIIFHDAA